MEAFTMEVAGLVVSVHPLYQFTKEYCRPYLTDKNPDVIIEVSKQDLAFEQLQLEREAIQEGIKIRKFPDSFLERSFIQRHVADYLVSQNTIMFHGSTVAVDGKAYLFTAPCGTGKSTHTRLWRDLFGDRAIMVNDDMPFLRISDSGVLAYGSPWSGKHGLASRICVPLQGICLLQRGSENQIHRSEPMKIRDMLHRQVHIPLDTSLEKTTFSLLDALLEMVPLWEMSCNKDLDAARIAYEAMSGALV